ncbi:MAG: hypothetical protein ETSY2_36730 [Candidatus Entotheonella gemina]|uniref:dTDP-4-dehydrorhamnose reductase n=1 Tax=Candidatus Entotheonella gemina TaxID=1429439 RepID=W4LWG9_9BACT|nr:MAG: hypothetical protein ETSY2_36730 [Candidatus Entotheonella gemina]
MIPKKILITGGAGMLATDLTEHFQSQRFYEPIALPRTALDITALDQVEAAFAAYAPDVVINTAALMVEECETSPESAYKTNTWGVRQLAQSCQRYHATFIQISSCGLFGDTIRAYHEYDSPVLKTVYAKTKQASEIFTAHFCEQYYVLRLGWLYGGQAQHRRNFVMARYREALNKPVLHSACDK